MNNVVSSNIHPEKGLRAQVLNKYLELASNYDTAVVFCGNIDLSLHPFKSCLTAESPVEVATSLYSFKHKFEIRNPYIYMLKLLARFQDPMLKGLWCKAPIHV